MERVSSVWSRAAALAALAWGAFHLYRAAALAITVDEAFTFHRFVGVRWLELLRSYDANHHVLHSVLCKLSVGALGASEWSLRLPAVAGGWAYLYFALRLARRYAGTGPAMFASFLWMAGLPQIAEYLSLARGYSLGLAFFAAALWFASEDEPKWSRVSALVGLSIASNLVFLIPCAALGFLALRRGANPRTLAAPAVAILAWFLAVPLSRASMDSYYFGVKTWNECIQSLLPFPWLKWAAAAVLALGTVRAWRCGRAREIVWLLPVSLAAIAILFVFFSVPLPYERTGIYLLAMTGLLVGPACRWAKAEWPLALLFGAAAVAGALHLSASQSGVWTFDSYNREAMTIIRSQPARAPRVAATFPLEHGAEFYRRIWRLPWPEVAQWRPGLECDYLLWRTDESHAPLPEGFEELARDARSGVLLGRRSAQR